MQNQHRRRFVHGCSVAGWLDPAAACFAQVLHLRGQPIPGLYACGSTSAHFYGIGYQAGCELGGAMTFGYLAAKHAAAASDSR